MSLGLATVPSVTDGMNKTLLFHDYQGKATYRERWFR